MGDAAEDDVNRAYSADIRIGCRCGGKGCARCDEHCLEVDEDPYGFDPTVNGDAHD